MFPKLSSRVSEANKQLLDQMAILIDNCKSHEYETMTFL